MAEVRVQKVTEEIKLPETKILVDRNLIHLSFDHVTLPLELSAKNREALGILLSIRHENVSKDYLLSLEECTNKTAEATARQVKEVLPLYNLTRYRKLSKILFLPIIYEVSYPTGHLVSKV